MKALIIYHDNCNDGFGAAWVMHNWITNNKLMEDIKLYPTSYGTPPPFNLINANTAVYILDFSYPLEELLAISDAAFLTIWIDHHKTAVPVFEALNIKCPVTLRYYFDMKHSGAMLTWKYCYPDKNAPLLIQHIEDRDMWWFKMEGTKEFHLNLNTFPKAIHTWNDISSDCSHPDNDAYATFLAEGAAIKRYYDSLLSDIISSCKHEFEIDGIKGLACNAPYAFASDIGNILAQESGTFGAVWSQNAKKDTVFSLRSEGDFDVSEMAKKFGGGGHKNAAGFTLSFQGVEGQSTLWSGTHETEIQQQS